MTNDQKAGSAINGLKIAQTIFKKLVKRVGKLKQEGIIPTLAVILATDDPASLAYIRQKQKTGEKIGAKLILNKLQSSVGKRRLKEIIARYNQDNFIHGIIIQLPLPPQFQAVLPNRLIKAVKDVDGFRKDSPFIPPVAKAVLTILRFIHSQVVKNEILNSKTTPQILPSLGGNGNFYRWLFKQNICILGRGLTAGKPIAETLQELYHNSSAAGSKKKINILHSKSKSRIKKLKAADIIISCVGKRGVVKSKMIKKGAILIGIGQHQENGKLRGDYDESDIATKTSFFTPTPGGVGPINVACLWENVVEAAEKSSAVN